MAAPHKFICLVSEDVRPEVGGKLTILGFMPSDKIDISPAPPAPVSLNLTFIFVFDDLVGSFSGTFTLTGPNGLVGNSVPMPPVTHPTPNSLASVYQFKPTPPLVMGQYVAKLVMNNQAYEKRFELRVAPAPPGASPPTGMPLN